MMRARTRARGAAGWMDAKSRPNSFSLWLVCTMFGYGPCAVVSSTSIWICGAPGAGVGSPDGLLGWSAMATVYTHLPAMSSSSTPSGRVIAVDLGTRRMGVAITDGLGLTAQPLET